MLSASEASRAPARGQTLRFAQGDLSAALSSASSWIGTKSLSVIRDQYIQMSIFPCTYRPPLLCWWDHLPSGSKRRPHAHHHPHEPCEQARLSSTPPQAARRPGAPALPHRAAPRRRLELGRYRPGAELRSGHGQPGRPPLPARGGAGPLGPSARQRTAEDHPCPAGPAQAVGGADAARVRLDAPYLDTGAVVATTGEGERRGPGPNQPGPPAAGDRCPPGPTTSHRPLPLARGAPAGQIALPPAAGSLSAAGQCCLLPG